MLKIKRTSETVGGILCQDCNQWLCYGVEDIKPYKKKNFESNDECNQWIEREYSTITCPDCQKRIYIK